jgi:hypothetical protein
MLGSNTLEIAIGIIFIYLLLSLICTVVNEAIANFIEQRGKNLLAGIKNLLNDPSFSGLAQYLYTHGLVGGVMQNVTNFNKTNKLPSYIAPTNFALALMDILGARGAGEVALQQTKTEPDATKKASATQLALDLEKDFAAAETAAKKVDGLKDFGKIDDAYKTLQKALTTGRTIAKAFPDPWGAIEQGMQKFPDNQTRQSLLALVDKTKRDVVLAGQKLEASEYALEKLRQNLENWFNSSMDRFAGWYKRWTRQICFVIGVILVVISNADTLALANRLARDSALRSAIVDAADSATEKLASDPSTNATKDHSQVVQQARQELLEQAEKLNLPLGWINPDIKDVQDPFETERIPKTDDYLGWFLKVVGLLISALAVSLGAPFWFDTLSKFMNVRGAGKVPETQSASTAPKASAP